MSSDLTAALQKLERSSQRLNALTDRASDTITHLEVLLDNFSIGIEASIAFGDKRQTVKEMLAKTKNPATSFFASVDNHLDEYRYLEYQRYGKDKRFHFVVRDFDGTLIGWSELARDIKIQAISVLPNLLRVLVEKIDYRIESAERALEEVSQILLDREE
jgi:hypothetical protein